MALTEWGHLLLVSFPDGAVQTWHASGQDRDLAAVLLDTVFNIVSRWDANVRVTFLSARLDVAEQVCCPALRVHQGQLLSPLLL